jgi:putative redox protein
MAQHNSAKIVWTGQGLNFQGSVGSGYEFVVSSGSEKIGGSPMEFVLAGVAGCTASDIVLILEKQRQNVRDVIVEAVGERAEDPPKVYTDVKLHYTVSGNAIDPKAVERAIRLSEEKYCSASAMLSRSGTRMQTTFEIVEVE